MYMHLCVLFSFSQSAATIHCPYEGVVKELMYEVEDVATKDHPFLMIEVEDEGIGKSSFLVCVRYIPRALSLFLTFFH